MEIVSEWRMAVGGGSRALEMAERQQGVRKWGCKTCKEDGKGDRAGESERISNVSGGHWSINWHR